MEKPAPEPEVEAVKIRSLVLDELADLFLTNKVPRARNRNERYRIAIEFLCKKVDDLADENAEFRRRLEALEGDGK